MKKKIFKFLVEISRVTKLNKLIIFLYNLSQKKPIILTHKDKVFGTFTDSNNKTFELHSQIRDLIKPGWRSMFKKSTNKTLPSNEEVLKKLNKWNDKIIKVESFLNTYSLSLMDKDVVEIGAFDGSFSYALGKFGSAKVTGTDMAAYYISSTPDTKVTLNEIDLKNEELRKIRDTYANAISITDASKVTFKEDDILSSGLENNSVDTIISWEVVEHLTDPFKAFSEMARILKPGGFAFHEYNPFFSIIGGHSLCTLDFFWGHARLNDSDFERYIDQFRENEKDVALNFFRNSLNRMSLADLKSVIEKVGLKPIKLLPLVNEEHVRYINNTVLSQVKALYPSVEVEDLISPFTWVVFQKEK